jgi:glycosyl-4,4'-diaponeurosporenoate acyltransferase
VGVLIDLGFEASLFASIVAWVVIGFTTGFGVHRIPLRRLERDNWLTRPRKFEDGGRFYERRLHIRSWKDKLPEKGDIFPGGFSKRTITDRSDGFLERFAAETRRAETVHWMNAVSGPLFLVWCSWPLGVVMICFGWAGHLPFVCIQRYNRSRIERTLARRHAAGIRRSPATDPTPS